LLPADPESLNLSIARARIVLSVLAMASLWVDPDSPGGMPRLTQSEALTLLSHLTYSITLLFLLRRRSPIAALPMIPTLLDVFFATLISFVTQGQTGPTSVFFVFAIIAVSTRPSAKLTIATIVASLLLYSTIIIMSTDPLVTIMMRPVYLAIIGYLIGFIGYQRSAFELQVQDLVKRAERVSIARSLHDGYVQALAGVNLRLESCRELLARGRVEETLTELQELQTGVAREYDGVRTYIRSLAGVDEGSRYRPVDTDLQCQLRATFSGEGSTGEHLLQMMLEGLRNARRHGMAHRVSINLSGDADRILLTIEDDGRGFADESSKPWAIASRVAELGGHLTVTNGDGWTRLTIGMPA
jgi:signal transduction histidine kinase